MNLNDTVTEAIVRELGKYLKDNVPGIDAVYDDFPSATQAIDMPCITIVTGSPRYQNLMPYLHSKGELNEETNKSECVYVIGQYDFSLQVDIWTKTKLERHEMYQKFFDTFNNNPRVPGLSIQLNDYHGFWARYDLDGLEFIDSEQSSQRGEWRASARVLASCKAGKKSLEHLMQTIENNSEVSESIVIPDDENDTETLI